MKATKVDGIYDADPMVHPAGAAFRDASRTSRSSEGPQGDDDHRHLALHGQPPGIVVFNCGRQANISAPSRESRSDLRDGVAPRRHSMEANDLKKVCNGSEPKGCAGARAVSTNCGRPHRTRVRDDLSLAVTSRSTGPECPSISSPDCRCPSLRDCGPAVRSLAARRHREGLRASDLGLNPRKRQGHPDTDSCAHRGAPQELSATCTR